MSTVLRVWSFATQLSDDDKVDLLKYFGAVKIKHVSQNNQNKAVLASFSSEEECRYALQKLHQQEILGVRLMAVLHGSSEIPHRKQPHEKTENDTNKETSRKEKIRKKIQEYEAQLSAIGSNFGINHPISPSLRYLYPPPSPSVIANIAKTLVAVPKFYTQVLHLMNKMNLPVPFGPVRKISHHYEESLKLMGFTTNDLDCNVTEKVVTGENKTSPKKNSANERTERSFQESSEETESELESDENEGNTGQIVSNVPIKRKLKPKNPINKKPKISLLQQTLVQHPRISEPSSVTDVFESSGSHKPRKLALHLEGTILPQGEKEVGELEPGGFGKIEAVKGMEKDELDNPVEWESQSKKYITKEEIQSNKISKTDWPLLTVFKNYNPGEPTSKLYIKNLAKNTNEDDLKFVFGRYIFWQNDEEAEMFNIRLMKEGRMKGQAFITFPSVEKATEALQDTNGFILKDKAMVVMFSKAKS